MTARPSPSGAAFGLTERTRDVYNKTAAAFDRDRLGDLHEQGWLNRFAAGLPEQAKVLDLGCGTGTPIAEWLMARGYSVTGVDFAPAMLDIARARFPSGDWRVGDMRSLDLPRRFDGIIAWNSFFHLTKDAQRATLPRLARHLKTGAFS